MLTDILFEDQDIIIAYKPAGLAVQTAQLGRQDMESELKNYLKQSYLGVVHRLDQPVEGLLVFGKNPKSTAAMNRQLSNSDFCKEYLAVVCGKPSQEQKELVDYLVKDGNRARVCVPSAAEKQQAKKAVLQYVCMKTANADTISLLKVTLQTGRFHQIRAQLSQMGNPILGDSKYENSESAFLSQKLMIRNVALCAHSLVFTHPVLNKKMEYSVSPRNAAFTFFTE